MNPVTHFRKTRILPLLSLGAIFALAITAHAQNLYVSVNGDFCGFHCTNSNGSISEYTPAGMQTTFASGLPRPRGLAFDSSGNLFAAVTYWGPPQQYPHGKILKFPLLGRQSILGNVDHNFFQGVVTDSRGNIFAITQSPFGDVSNIYKFAPDGTRTLFGSVGPDGFDLALDTAGNLFASSGDDQIIYKFTPNGTRSIFVSSSAFGPNQFPNGLAYSAGTSTLFVSTEGNPGNDAILEFTNGGMALPPFAIGLTNPRGLGFDGTGNLFVVESNEAPDGDILKFAPGGGPPTVFASGLDYPENLAFGPPR